MQIKKILAAGIAVAILGGCAAVPEEVPSQTVPTAAPAVSQKAPETPQQVSAAAKEPGYTGKAGSKTFTLPPLQESAPIKAMRVETPEDFPQFQDQALSFTVILGGEVVFEGTAAELKQFTPERNGLYTYHVFEGDAAGEGKEISCFQVEAAIPVEVGLSSDTIIQGETLYLTVKYADGLEVGGSTNLLFQPVFYEEEGFYGALLPVHYNTSPGTYQLTVQAGEEKFPFQITVEAKEFPVQNLWVDDTVTSDTVDNDAANKEWNEKIEPLKYTSLPVKYWDGPFLQPVQGRVTTEFGTIRYTNGSKTASRHGGVDLAIERGTPVLSTNRGKVVFSEFIQMTGNTVCVEHGLGLKSWYYHMDSLNVKEGDMVEQGDLIGTVGTTGFSTGPHLHYALSVNQVYINPWTAFDNGIG